MNETANSHKKSVEHKFTLTNEINLVDVYLGYDGENWIAYKGENENAIPEPDKDI